MKRPAIDALTINTDDPVGEIAQTLIRQLCAEMSERYGAAPSPFSFSEAAMDRTIFLVARLGNQPVGCGALRRIDNDSAEIKRMYVSPPTRRCGVARRIVGQLEHHAIAFGYHAIRLETGILQPDAQRCYESCGYERIAAFGSYIGSPSSICYEKRLG